MVILKRLIVMISIVFSKKKKKKTFDGNRVFADVIKARIKMRPSLVRVSPKSNESVLIIIKKKRKRGHSMIVN